VLDAREIVRSIGTEMALAGGAALDAAGRLAPGTGTPVV
jgi:hypothetical protein